MKLVLQRGHVPRTSGSVGTAGEQQLVTRIATRVVELAPSGLEVAVIDADEPSSRYRGDAFVALHADGSSNRDVGGASIGYRTPQGRDLGEAWKDRYRANGWPGKFRGDNYTRALSGYYGTREAVKAGNTRAVIVEHGFLTNPSERAWMTSPAGIDAAARAVIEAVTGRPLTTDDLEDDVIRDGDDIRDVQEDLNWLRTNGFSAPPYPKLAEDGVWGPNTLRALDVVRGVYGRRPRGARPTAQDVAKLDRFIHEVKHHDLKVPMP